MGSYTRGAPTVFFLGLLWPLLPPAAAAVEVDPSGGVPFMGGNYEGHPMLYFDRAEVEELQARASGTHRDLARRIRQAGEAMLEHPENYLPPWSPAEFSARWNEVYGNNLGVLSMFCLLYPHRAGALDLARDYMERMAAQPSWYFFCFCFVLYPHCLCRTSRSEAPVWIPDLRSLPVALLSKMPPNPDLLFHVSQFPASHSGSKRSYGDHHLIGLCSPPPVVVFIDNQSLLVLN